MERFAAHPEASIPAACDGWSETVAAHRFLSITDVDWRAILEPHWARTPERMRAHPVMLCIQGTTELNFNGQEAAGLGHSIMKPGEACMCTPLMPSRRNASRWA